MAQSVSSDPTGFLGRFHKETLLYTAAGIGVIAFGALIWYLEQKRAAAQAASNAAADAALQNAMANSAYQATIGANMAGTGGGYMPYSASGSYGMAGMGTVTPPANSGSGTATSGTTSGAGTNTNSDITSQISSLLSSFKQQMANSQSQIQAAIAAASGSQPTSPVSQLTGLQQQIASLQNQNSQLTAEHNYAVGAWNAIEQVANNSPASAVTSGKINTLYGNVIRRYQGQQGL